MVEQLDRILGVMSLANIEVGIIRFDNDLVISQ